MMLDAPYRPGMISAVATGLGPIALSALVLGAFMASILLRSRFVTSIQNMLYLHMAVANSILGLLCIARLFYLIMPSSYSEITNVQSNTLGENKLSSYPTNLAGNWSHFSNRMADLHMKLCYTPTMVMLSDMALALSLASVVAIACHHNITVISPTRVTSSVNYPQRRPHFFGRIFGIFSRTVSCFAHLWIACARHAHSAPWIASIWLFALIAPTTFTWLRMSESDSLNTYLSLEKGSSGAIQSDPNSLQFVAHAFLCLADSDVNQLVHSGWILPKFSQSDFNIVLSGLIQLFVWGFMGIYTIRCYTKATHVAKYESIMSSRSPQSDIQSKDMPRDGQDQGASGVATVFMSPPPSLPPTPMRSPQNNNSETSNIPSSVGSASSDNQRIHYHHPQEARPLIPSSAQQSLRNSDIPHERQQFSPRRIAYAEIIKNSMIMSIPAVILMFFKALLGMYESMLCIMNRNQTCQSINTSSPVLAFAVGPVSGVLYSLFSILCFFALNRTIRRVAFALLGLVSRASMSSPASTGSATLSATSGSSAISSMSTTTDRFTPSSSSPAKQPFVLQEPPSPSTREISNEDMNSTEFSGSVTSVPDQIISSSVNARSHQPSFLQQQQTHQRQSSHRNASQSASHHALSFAPPGIMPAQSSAYSVSSATSSPAIDRRDHRYTSYAAISSVVMVMPIASPSNPVQARPALGSTTHAFTPPRTESHAAISNTINAGQRSRQSTAPLIGSLPGPTYAYKNGQ